MLENTQKSPKQDEKNTQQDVEDCSGVEKQPEGIVEEKSKDKADAVSFIF